MGAMMNEFRYDSGEVGFSMYEDKWATRGQSVCIFSHDGDSVTMGFNHAILIANKLLELLPVWLESCEPHDQGGFVVDEDDAKLIIEKINKLKAEADDDQVPQ